MTDERKRARHEVKTAMLEAAHEWDKSVKWNNTTDVEQRPCMTRPQAEELLHDAINEFARLTSEYASGEVPQVGDEAAGNDGCVWRVDGFDAVVNPRYPIKATCVGFVNNPITFCAAWSKQGDVKDLKPSWLTKLEPPKTCGDCEHFMHIGKGMSCVSFCGAQCWFYDVEEIKHPVVFKLTGKDTKVCDDFKERAE